MTCVYKLQISSAYCNHCLLSAIRYDLLSQIIPTKTDMIKKYLFPPSYHQAKIKSRKMDITFKTCGELL